MTKEKTSLVWRFFTPKNDEERATCMLCMKEYSRKGKSTTPLRGHLRAMHSEVLQNEFESLARDIKTDRQIKQENGEPWDENDVDKEGKPKKKKRQYRVKQEPAAGASAVFGNESIDIDDGDNQADPLHSLPDGLDEAEISERTDAIKSFLCGLVPELECLTDDQLRLFRRKVFRLIDSIATSKEK